MNPIPGQGLIILTENQVTFFYLVIVVDDSNFLAENAINGALMYAKTNNLGVITETNLIKIGDKEAYQTVDKGIECLQYFKHHDNLQFTNH